MLSGTGNWGGNFWQLNGKLSPPTQEFFQNTKKRRKDRKIMR